MRVGNRQVFPRLPTPQAGETSMAPARRCAPPGRNERTPGCGMLRHPMDPQRRSFFNQAFNQDIFARFMKRMENRLNTTFPFRVAETPLIMTHELRDKLARYSSEITTQLSQPSLLAELKKAIPAKYDVPGMDGLPNCVQVDFALTQDAAGNVDGKVVELQAFPSLYALMTVMSDAWSEELKDMPGMDKEWDCFINVDRAAAVEMMTRTIVGAAKPEETVLVDFEPENQKTQPDFAATQEIFGVDSVCVTKLVKKGKQLFREKNGALIPVKRIYNRMVFDELEVKGAKIPFDWREELDVTWCSHPNWYWTWSKYALPFITHPAVPKATFLDQLPEIPADLTRYVLKPLFSFAGAGVVVDVTRADVDAVPADQRHGWVLQEKIDYAPVIPMPNAEGGVKAEVRVMLLRPPESQVLTPIMCLVRLSRGKMLGVDFNKGLTWVGGSVGMWVKRAAGG